MWDQPDNEWEYDVATRVHNAVASLQNRDGDLATAMHLRWQVRKLMQAVRLTDLSARELVSMLAILAPANGRRLIRGTFEEVLRPLRLVDNAVDLGDAPPELSEELPDHPDEVAGGDLVQPV
jgi:hypothetical protein